MPKHRINRAAEAVAEAEKTRARNAAIDAFHPGPDPDFQFPAPELETPHEKLARLEKELVDRAVANATGGLAMQILLLRAEING